MDEEEQSEIQRAYLAKLDRFAADTREWIAERKNAPLRTQRGRPPTHIPPLEGQMQFDMELPLIEPDECPPAPKRPRRLRNAG